MANNPNFRRELSLRYLLSKPLNSREAYIIDIFRKYKPTRFWNKQAKGISQLLENPKVVKNGKIVLLNGLSHQQDVILLREKLIKRIKSFSLKSASDFMIDVGLSHDVIT